MNTQQQKEEIYDFIDHADDKFIRLIYSMVESERSQAGFLNVSHDEMMERAKKSIKSVDEGMTRSIYEFKNDILTWKEKRAIQ